MNYKERLLYVLKAPHVSEKASTMTEKDNTIVLKVSKDATKVEVISAVMEIFGVKAKKVNTVIMKGKRKQRGKHAGQRSSWKKAYITLEQGQSLDIASGSE